MTFLLKYVKNRSTSIAFSRLSDKTETAIQPCKHDE